MDERTRELDEWRCMVGTAILSFGDIEFITLKCLAHIPSDTIVKVASHLPFSRRVDLIVEILEGRSSQSQSVMTLIAKLKRAKALSEYRNVIAHNPLLLDLYINQATGDMKAERAITAARSDGKSIDLPGLTELATEAESLASELYLVLGKIVEELGEAK